jgi:glucosylceramidase
MNNKNTRRDFLKSSGVGIATLASTTLLPKNLAAAGPETGGMRDISVWITEGERRVEKQAPAKWKVRSGPGAANNITVDSAKSFQPILGFGAAFTDAACYTFNRLDAAARETLFHELFHPSEMGLSVCRTCVGSSDYSTEAYTYDEGGPDPELTRFSIAHDRPYLLPMLREARKMNPDLFLFSSPWTPPGWMKSNNSMLGGNMQRHYMASYADYFLKFLQGYEAEGVFVNAITVQNEVDTDQDGRMPQCTWPMEYEADFVRQYLGPTFEKNGVKTKIWIIDHNYNLWGRAIGELETPDVRKYTNAIAWHGYVGKPEWMMRVLQAYPEVEMYWTEGGPDYTDPNYLKDWTTWTTTFIGILRNGCRSITGWNLALDEHGKPNIGPFNCGGMVTIHSQTKEITRSGQHWAFAHFSRFIKRGSHRIESTGGSEIAHAAFQNPDGSRVLILANSGPGREVEIRAGQQSTSIQLGQNAVATLVWNT